jgi:hypothetical protein
LLSVGSLRWHTACVDASSGPCICCSLEINIGNEFKKRNLNILNCFHFTYIRRISE